MKRKTLNSKIQNLLWARAAGRCEFEGCNCILTTDNLTQDAENEGQIAHIVAASKNGPRANDDSESLQDSIENLMLLCPRHHKLIDGSNENKYPPELLHAMKRKHEERIALATSITPNKQSIIVIYTSSVGKQKPSIDYRDAVDAMFPTFYPTADSPIDLSTNTPFNDNEECYWATEKMALDRNYRDKVSCLLANGYPNISIFAIAPQPLLVYLGTLLGDIHKISVFQKHREPNTWRWLDMESNNAFILNEPPSKNGRPILVFAISSQNIEKRIKNLYNKDESIWIIRCKEPNNDMLISPKQLSEFRALVRKVMDDINKTSSNDEIRIHMSMPIACAIELGRIRMPKADKSWMLFDYHRDTDKELETITIQ